MVKPDRVYIALGTALGATLPWWLAVPVVGYLLEIVLTVTLIMAALERQWWIPVGGAVLGLALGQLPSLGPLPMVVFLPLWLKAVVPAVILGIMVRDGRTAGRAYLAAAILATLAILLFFAEGGVYLRQAVDTLQKAMGGTLESGLKSRGYAPEAIVDAMDALASVAQLIKRLLPGMLVLSGLSQLLIAFLFVEWYYTRRDRFFPGFGPFIFWKMPERLLYILGIALALRLAAPGSVQVVVDNFLVILAVAYAVTGLAVIEHLLRRIQLPLAVKIIFYLGLLLMQLPGLIVSSLLGLFDSHFDFRKVRAHTLG